MIQICLESEIQEAEGHEFQIENTRIRVLRWQGQIIAYQGLLTLSAVIIWRCLSRTRVSAFPGPVSAVLSSCLSGSKTTKSQ